jgi:hypothetical protein
MKSFQKLCGIISGTGRGIPIDDNRVLSILPAAEQSHIRLGLRPAFRFMLHLQGRLVSHYEWS